jgi:hypothetical protein
MVRRKRKRGEGERRNATFLLPNFNLRHYAKKAATANASE